MSGPEISPMLARMAGDDYRGALKSRLEQLASESDDPAYASRLRLVAQGKRPLRTLLSDPAWAKSFEFQQDELAAPAEMSDEDREAMDRKVEELRERGDHHVSAEQARLDAEEIADNATRTRDAIRQEQSSGWSMVHEVESEEQDEGQEGGGQHRER